MGADPGAALPGDPAGGRVAIPAQAGARAGHTGLRRGPRPPGPAARHARRLSPGRTGLERRHGAHPDRVRPAGRPRSRPGRGRRCPTRPRGAPGRAQHHGQVRVTSLRRRQHPGPRGRSMRRQLRRPQRHARPRIPSPARPGHHPARAAALPSHGAAPVAAGWAVACRSEMRGGAPARRAASAGSAAARRSTAVLTAARAGRPRPHVEPSPGTWGRPGRPTTGSTPPGGRGPAAPGAARQSSGAGDRARWPGRLGRPRTPRTDRPAPCRLGALARSSAR